MLEVVEVAAIGPTRRDDLRAASGTIAFLVVRDDAIVDERCPSTPAEASMA